MPQGRRKIPFSGKAKKEQLKVKKQGKTKSEFASSSRRNLLQKPQSEDESSDGCNIQKLNHQPNRGGRAANKYTLQFFKETNDELKKSKELAWQSLQNIDQKNLEMDADAFFSDDFDFPVRPGWSFDNTKDVLEMKENKYFREYVDTLQGKYDRTQLSFFELNLETWRQLWRVLEMSDVILFIVDIRFPVSLFPPSLYKYITVTLKKHMILILNKIDLAPTPLVAAWKNYFLDKYPGLHVLMFTTLPGYNLIGAQMDKAGLQIRRKKGRVRMAAEGTKLLLDACKSIVGNDVDLSSWEEKIREESAVDFNDAEVVEIGEITELKKTDTSYFEHEKFKNGIFTIGCVGQPNVGKSSLMNAIMGKKVVSVSRTPGHTKHFQTIFLTKNVRLCDCPGIVFPSKVPKVLQILMGSFPIAQLREPFSAVKYLAEHLDLPKLLRITHPSDDDSWSAMDVCDGWAKKRGYITAKAARLDSYRAANSLLRMALDGKICLSLAPPGYFDKIEYWSHHPDAEVVQWIKAIKDDGETVKPNSNLQKSANASDISDEDDGISDPAGDVYRDSGQESDQSSDGENEDDPSL